MRGYDGGRALSLSYCGRQFFGARSPPKTGAHSAAAQKRCSEDQDGGDQDQRPKGGALRISARERGRVGSEPNNGGDGDQSPRALCVDHTDSASEKVIVVLIVASIGGRRGPLEPGL